MNDNISEKEEEKEEEEEGGGQDWRRRKRSRTKNKEKREGCFYSFCNIKRKASLIKICCLFFLISGWFS